MAKNKAKYVDGFVIPVKKKDLATYRKMAKAGAKIWKKYGALEYFECAGEDLKAKKGMGPGFPKLAKLRPGETVVFSFVTYKSRKHRDQVNAKIMKDPGMNDPQWEDKQMPFDMKRFYYGGFDVIVSA